MAKVFLAVRENQENLEGNILGHTIVRRDAGSGDLASHALGLISTTYVIPAARRAGVADQLLRAGEAWFQTLALPKFATWTSATNFALIRLYEKHGYAIAEAQPHETTGTKMVKLEKCVGACRKSCDANG